MIPVLLDTDIGSDIDDALTLAYLLRQPECELVGITTGTGDTCKRAALARWLCDAAGKPEIPVLAGLAGPLLTGPGQPEVPQYEAFRGRTPHPVRSSPPSTLEKGRGDARNGACAEAIDFLRSTIRARPGEITLLAIGPLTNIGALFVADPEIPALLKRIVLMCGTFGQTFSGRLCHTEWNAHCDPIAAAVVFRQAVPGTLVSVGLDVTLECKLSLDACWSMFDKSDPMHAAVLAMAEIWSKDAENVVFHDPLAGALIFRPELCELESGMVEVALQDGATLWKPSVSGPHQICIAVEVHRLFDEYFGTIKDKLSGGM